MLWPHSKISMRNIFSINRNSVNKIEDFFSKKYDGVGALLFSSGRAALSCLMEYYNIHRNDYVWVPPFSSHCVLNTIAYHGTPCPILHDKNKLAVVYHQWGYPFYLKQKLIEDSVDSLCISKNGLFPNDGEFEFFSLPKIIGSRFGGIVICKDPEKINLLRQVRDARDKPRSLQFYFRSNPFRKRSHDYYWGTTEMRSGAVHRLALGDILAKIKNWDQIVDDREQKINLLKTIGTKNKYQLFEDRLPTCWILENRAEIAEVMRRNGIFEHPKNVLRTQNIDNLDTDQVLPLPIHFQVDLEVIKRVTQELKNV